MSCRAHAYSAKAPSQVPVADVEASRADPYEYVVEPDDWFVDLLELEDIRGAVLVLNDRLHR